MSDPIKYLGDLQRLEIRPGDRFVLTTTQMLSAEQRRRLEELWKQFVGGDDSAALLILDAGFKLGVIGKADPKPTPAEDTAEVL